MPITGRPSKLSSGMPWFFIQLRWMKRSLIGPPNHCWERSFFVLSPDIASAFHCSFENAAAADASGRIEEPAGERAVTLPGIASMVEFAGRASAAVKTLAETAAGLGAGETLDYAG